eukprot:gene4805-5435_t
MVKEVKTDRKPISTAGDSDHCVNDADSKATNSDDNKSVKSRNNSKSRSAVAGSKRTGTRGRKSAKPSTNAARERSRVQNLKQAFLELQKALPNVPTGTKLSKLDILLLATNYISHLMSKLSNGHLKQHLSRLKDTGTLHPIKKWPMRSRLYVSDPMWLYRSGRQHGIMKPQQNFDSSSSSSMVSSDEEESSRTITTTTTKGFADDISSSSPTESILSDGQEGSSAMPACCRSSCSRVAKKNPHCCNGASQHIDLSSSYAGAINSYSTTSQYQDISIQNISSVLQNIIPELQADNQ